MASMSPQRSGIEMRAIGAAAGLGSVITHGTFGMGLEL